MNDDENNRLIIEAFSLYFSICADAMVSRYEMLPSARYWTIAELCIIFVRSYMVEHSRLLAETRNFVSSFRFFILIGRFRSVQLTRTSTCVRSVLWWLQMQHVFD